MKMSAVTINDNHALIVGGKKGCSSALVISPLQQLAQKAREWKHQESIQVFDGDIYKAFDHLSPSMAAHAMLHYGIKPQLVAA